MTDYINDYETALKALERLYGETGAAANNAHELKDKARLVKLERQIVNIREKLRLLYYEIQDADTDVSANKCTCPCVTKAGQRMPMVVDKGCNAYTHGSIAEDGEQ